MKIRKVPGAIDCTSKVDLAQLTNGRSNTDVCPGWNHSFSILDIVGAAGLTARTLRKETPWPGPRTFIRLTFLDLVVRVRPIE
jgi:hypothetical protein